MSGKPREIYIASILLIFLVFGLLYLASINTMLRVGTLTTCTSNDLITEGVGSGFDRLDTSNSGLFDNVFTKIGCVQQDAPLINYIFIILSFILFSMILIVLLHG